MSLRDYLNLTINRDYLLSFPDSKQNAKRTQGTLNDIQHWIEEGREAREGRAPSKRKLLTLFTRAD